MRITLGIIFAFPTKVCIVIRGNITIITSQLLLLAIIGIEIMYERADYVDLPLVAVEIFGRESGRNS